MERKQLLKRLESMKKEFARKERKLEKANRAARVKAHVRKKIQELNLQTTENQWPRNAEETGSQECQRVTDGQSCQQVTDDQSHQQVTDGQSCQQGTDDQSHQQVTDGQSCQQGTDDQSHQQVTDGQSCQQGTDDHSCQQVTGNQQLLSVNDHSAQTATGQCKISSDILVSTEGQQHDLQIYQQQTSDPGVISVKNSTGTSFSCRDTTVIFTTNIKNNILHQEDIDTSEETKDLNLQTEAKNVLLQVKDSSHCSNKHCDSCIVKTSDLDNVAAVQELSTPDIEDSFMVTPTFRSLRDTGTDFPENHIDHLPLDSFLNIDSCANTSSLNLNSQNTDLNNRSNMKLEKNVHEYASKPMDKNVKSVAVSKEDSENICPAKARMLADNIACHTVNISLNTKDGVVTSKQENITSEKKESSNLMPSSVNSSEAVLANSSLPDSVSKPSHGGTQLRLQDISCEEDADLPSKSQLMASASDKTCHGKFLDYTELDAIPFSQFELTEDFLSEYAENATDGCRTKKGKKGTSSLVQRRSPRLSAFEFDSCDTSEKHQMRRPRSQQTALYRMARNQKKTKKALLLSSMFQYLIDEAKRDTSFVEFKLPVDITDSALLSSKGTVTDIQTVGSMPQCSGSEEYATDSSDLEVIPETETILDYVDKFQSNSEDTEGNQLSKEKSQSHMKDSSDKDGISVKKATQQSQEDPETFSTETKVYAAGTAHHTLDSTDASMVKADAVTSENDQHDTSKRETSLQQAKVDHFKAVQNSLTTLKASPNRLMDEDLIKSLPTAQILPSLPVQSLNSNSHFERQCADNENPNPQNQEAENKSLTILEDHTAQHRETIGADQSEDLDIKSKDADRHAVTNEAIQCTESKNDNFKTASSDSTLHYSLSKQSPVKEMCDMSIVSKDSSASSVLINTQLHSKREKESLNAGREWKPVFTPSKHKSEKTPEETANQIKIQDKCSVTFDGCAESGCAGAVMDTIVGTTVADSDSGEVPFILCVQTTSLTLWVREDDHQWSAEFHWYLEKNSSAEGACRVYTHDQHLAALVWGFNSQSVACRLTLTIFVYNWDTRHTQRFSLPLPSPVCPYRVFCHGLQSLEDSVLVFTTDRAWTVGRRYKVDRCHSCVGEEVAMEGVNSQLKDLSLVEHLSDAVVGLTMDRSLLIWNHKNGSLIFTLPLPDNLLAFSRMFTCYSLQGYLLFHMAKGEGSKDMYLVALNPTTGSGKLIRMLTAHGEQHTEWLSVAACQDSLLAVNTSGTVHLCDPYLGELLSICSPSSKTRTVAMIHSKDGRILLTGQESGCLHLFSVCS